MNKTLSFAKLDFITIKPFLTIKNLSLLLCVASFLVFGTDSPSATISMVIMYATMFAVYPFAVGEQNGIDALYSTLPISRSVVVAGRYLFAVLVNIAAVILSFGLTAIVYTILRREFIIEEMLLTVVVCFSVFVFMQAVQLPFYFKLGYNKAKIIAYLPLLAFPVCVFILSKLFGSDALISGLVTIATWIETHVILSFLILFAVLLSVLFISYRISLGYYKKRDF